MRFHSTDPKSMHGDIDDEVPYADRFFPPYALRRHEKIGYFARSVLAASCASLGID
jgi:hypothetical protein